MDKRVTSDKDTRRRYSEELKQALVELSLEPGASVAAIAQEHGINANLLFNWRGLRLRAEAPAVADAAPPALLPVTVQMEAAAKTIFRQSPCAAQLAGSNTLRNSRRVFGP